MNTLFTVLRHRLENEATGLHLQQEEDVEEASKRSRVELMKKVVETLTMWKGKR